MINLADIFGQGAAIDWLLAAYRAGKLPHALIFSGPAGVGKATTARAMGALWLCENPKSDKPCGKCESCRAMEVAQHPDFHLIYKELIRQYDKTGKSKAVALSIEVIRADLVDKASRKTVMGRGKVFAIEQAELMSRDAQNSMLKVLEEPAGRTLIILLADSPGSLLPTIRSRCQNVPFALLPEKTVRDELVKRGQRKEAAEAATGVAGGSLGLALKWLDDGVIVRAGELGEMLKSAGSRDPVAELPHWLKKAADEYAEKQMVRDELCSKDQATREGIGVYLRIAAEQFRRRLAEVDDPDDLERVSVAIDAIVRSEQYLDANVTISLVSQQLAVSLDGK